MGCVPMPSTRCFSKTAHKVYVSGFGDVSPKTRGYGNSIKLSPAQTPRHCKALIDVATEGLLHPSGAPGLCLRSQSKLPQLQGVVL